MRRVIVAAATMLVPVIAVAAQGGAQPPPAPPACPPSGYSPPYYAMFGQNGGDGQTAYEIASPCIGREVRDAAIAIGMGRNRVHTDKMEVTERFRREDDLLPYNFTVNAPDVLMEPWTSITYVRRLNPNPVRQDEAPICEERDLELLADPFNRG